MVIKILGDPQTAAYKAAVVKIKQMKHAIYDPDYFFCDLAVAPLLTHRITVDEINTPELGTLIFHPSPLPYGRGASSIRWAYRRHEPITAASWFWADEGLDTGDVCEMEVLKIDYSLSPKAYYEQHIIPAMLRTLERCLNDIEKGFKRRIPQRDEHSTYDAKL